LRHSTESLKWFECSLSTIPSGGGSPVLKFRLRETNSTEMAKKVLGGWLARHDEFKIGDGGVANSVMMRI